MEKVFYLKHVINGITGNITIYAEVGENTITVWRRRQNTYQKLVMKLDKLPFGITRDSLIEIYNNPNIARSNLELWANFSRFCYSEATDDYFENFYGYAEFDKVALEYDEQQLEKKTGFRDLGKLK